MRHKLDMPVDYHPWLGSHAMGGMPSKHSSIFKESVEVAFWDWAITKKLPIDSIPHWFVDTSQAIVRKQWGSVVPSVARRSKVYMFHVDRVMDSEDCLWDRGETCLFVRSVARPSVHV